MGRASHTATAQPAEQPRRAATTQPTQRAGKGFRRVSTMVEAMVRQASKGRGFAIPQILTHWHEAVGADLAAMCRPVAVNYGQRRAGATLTVLAAGAQAPIVEMQKETLRTRVNAVLGYNAIARLRITQTACIGFGEEKAVFAAKSSPAAPSSDPAAAHRSAQRAAQAAKAMARGVKDPQLRDALQLLVRDFYLRQSRKGGKQ